MEWGKKLYGKVPKVFHEADEILNMNLSKMMFDGDFKVLTKTSNAQPAILTYSYALFKYHTTIASLGRWNFDAAMGHSLGEYTALTCADALDFKDAVQLVRKRGELMEETTSDSFDMVALIPCSQELAQSICDEVNSTTKNSSGADEKGDFHGLCCDVANVNSEVQVVISGHRDAVGKAMEVAKKKGVKRCTPLSVGAPFHSRLMMPAARKLRPYLDSVHWRHPKFPLVSNVTAKEIENVPNEIAGLLEKQVYSTIQWHQCVCYAKAKHGADKVKMVEFGPKPILTNMVSRELQTEFLQEPVE